MAYAFSGPRWASNQITWSFALNTYPQDPDSPFSASIAGDFEQGFFLGALATWAGVAGLDFVQVDDSPNTDLRLGWGRFGALSGQIGQADYRYNVLTQVISPGAIIRLEDPAELPLQQEPDGPTVYSGTSSAIYGVAVHEIGHALGLAHNDDAASIMFPTAGRANRQLSFDDGFGIQLLYGDLDQNFRATAVRDVFYGFAGNDTVAWNGPLADYTVSRSDGGTTVSRNANAADQDIVFDVEALQFADTRIAVSAEAGLFDPAAYALANPDVVSAGFDPRQHFDTLGWREDRSTGSEFNTVAYLGANPEVRAAGINPLAHYQTDGWREGRDPIAGFDVRLYLIHNPDVAEAGIEPLAHYLQRGRAEGRVAWPAVGDHIVGGFDAQHYMLSNPDIARAGLDAQQHWQQNGRFEGRSPNAWFDTRGYLNQHADVAEAGLDPLAHYMTCGWREGHDPSEAFDTQAYLAAYRDVAEAGVNPLDHFLLFGIYEGRSGFGDGVLS